MSDFENAYRLKPGTLSGLMGSAEMEDAVEQILLWMYNNDMSYNQLAGAVVYEEIFMILPSLAHDGFKELIENDWLYPIKGKFFEYIGPRMPDGATPYRVSASLIARMSERMPAGLFEHYLVRNDGHPVFRACPFCGGRPAVRTKGSCIDIECCASMSIQKSDHLTMEEREKGTKMGFPADIEIELLRIAAEKWNRRAR